MFWWEWVIPSALCACGAFLTISFRCAYKIYSLSNQWFSSHPTWHQIKNRPARSVCVLVGVGDSLGTLCLRGIPDDFVSLRLQNLLFVEPVVLISPYLAQNKNRPARSVCVLVGVGGFEPPQA